VTAGPAAVAPGYRRDALAVAASRMAPLAVQLLATPFVIAAVGAESYAAWALMMTTINLLLTADLGVVGIMQRYHAVARGREDTALAGRITATVLAVLGVLLVVVTLTGPAIADVVLRVVEFPPDVEPGARLLFRNAGTLAALQLLALALSSYLAAHGRFLALAGVSLCARVVLAVGIVVAISGGHGLAGLLIASYADAATAVVLGVFLCRRHLFREVRGLTTRDEGQELWAYAWRNQASALGFVAQRELDVLIAGALLSTAALATMAASAPLAAAACLAPTVLLTPLFTSLSVSAGSDDGATASAAARAESSWFELVLPFGALILGVLPFAASAWIGPGVTGVASVTAVLAAGFLVSLLGSVRAILARAVGRPGIETASYGAFVTVKLVAGIGLALAFGILGLAASGLLASIASVIVLRRGSEGSIVGSLGRLPSARAWAGATAVLLGSGGLSWIVSRTIEGRYAQLGALVVVGIMAAGTVLLHRRTKSSNTPR
jgi:O-antigen/teichoic acid export membrane protein